MEQKTTSLEFQFFKTLAQYNIGNPKEIITQKDSVTLDTTITYPMKFALAFKVEDNRYSFKEESVEQGFFSDTTYISTQSNSDLIKIKYEVDAKFILNEHPK